MSARPTLPPIVEQQNTAPFQLLLAAQRRLYAEVKRSHNRRLIAVIVLSVLTLIVGGGWPEARSAIGGVTALVLGERAGSACFGPRARPGGWQW